MHDFAREARTHNQALTDLKNIAVMVREHYARHPGVEIRCRIHLVLPTPAPEPPAAAAPVERL